jgi:lipopolysaccharide export LptBFGC system permease protein LptF
MAVTFVVLFTQSFGRCTFVIDNYSTLGVFLQLMGLTVPTFLPLIVPISLA